MHTHKIAPLSINHITMQPLPDNHYLHVVAKELDPNHASLYRTGSTRAPTAVAWLMTSDSPINWGDDTIIQFLGAIIHNHQSDPHIVLLGCKLSQDQSVLQFIFPINTHGTQKNIGLVMLGELAIQPTLTSTLLNSANLFREWTHPNTLQQSSQTALRYTKARKNHWTEEHGAHAISTFLTDHPEPDKQWNLLTHHASLCPSLD